MRNLIFLFIIIGSMTCLGSNCEKNATAGECTLKAGENSNCGFIGLDIRFTGALSDSRCPKDVECIWAGEVVVGLTVNQRDIQLTLGPKPGADTTSVGGYLLRLLEVNPYPVAGQQIPPENYSIKLGVSRE